ncbi:hypothetical protein [uncultured Rubinisphaera sp.]|uniref:hypothetical protein n=1 Tax=uncultured Rubinisphaera sp. TaxID=1678686 RepID=UPI0030DC9E97|tara:strand:- start:2414 stop:3583 length:1170 start_codon:yes stop_codon:yes gene_type:complete
MGRLLSLAWKHARFRWVRTCLLISGLSLAISIPLATSLMTGLIESSLLSRAEQVPFVVGPPGSADELVVNTLYFRPHDNSLLDYGVLEKVEQDRLVSTIPIHLRHTSHHFPIVGTSRNYFLKHRHAVQGKIFERIGDCVLGADVALQLGLSIGESILSDSDSYLNPTGALPLRMRIVGILKASHSPDDRAVFVDMKTGWLLDGIGHGHAAALHDSVNKNASLSATHGGLTAGGVSYLEVTDENYQSFHFHGNQDAFPLTSLMVYPKDERSGIIWEGRLAEDQTLLTVRPVDVIRDLLGVLVNIQQLVNTIALILGIIVSVLFAVIVAFSLQLRQTEMQTLDALGASRFLRVQLICYDLLLIVLLTLPISAFLSYGMIAIFRPWIEQILL